MATQCPKLAFCGNYSPYFVRCAFFEIFRSHSSQKALAAKQSLAVSTAPTNLSYPQGDIRRYGAALNGTTDDTVAVQRWANVAPRMASPGYWEGLKFCIVEPPYDSTIDLDST